MIDANIPVIGEVYDHLLKYIKEQSKSDVSQEINQQEVTSFKKSLRRYFSIPKRSLKEFFNGRGEMSNYSKLEKIRLLHFGFNVPYNIYEADIKEEHIFTKYSPKLSSLKEFVPLNYAGKTKRDEQEFIKRYIGGVEKYIKSATLNLTIYEYLGKGRMFGVGSALTYYEEVHKEVFRQIEKQLTDNPKMEYTRFLALPFSATVLKEATANKEKYTIDAFQACSIEVFKHICRSYKLDNQNRVNFYIVWRPTRLYHYGIIDDTYIVSEYYRYRRRGDFVPDLLFVQDVSNEEYNPLGDLWRTYKDEIDNKLAKDNDERSFKLSIDDFHNAVNKAENRTNNTLKELEKELETAKLEKDGVEKAEKECGIWRAKKKMMKAKIKTYEQIFSPLT